MALPNTLDFATIKNTVLSRASKLEVCNNYYEILNSTDWDSFLKAACGLYAWAYLAAIMDDETLASIPEENLNKFGIYVQGNVTLNNPYIGDYSGCKNNYIVTDDAPLTPQTIYSLANNVMTLNLDNAMSCDLYAMGNSSVNINISNNSKCTLRSFNNSLITVSLLDYSVLCFEINDQTVVQINSQGNSSIMGQARMNASCSYIGTQNASLVIKLFANSLLSYTAENTVSLDIRKFNNSKVTISGGDNT